MEKEREEEGEEERWGEGEEGRQGVLMKHWFEDRGDTAERRDGSLHREGEKEDRKL